MSQEIYPFQPNLPEVNTLYKNGHVLFNLDQTKNVILKAEGLSLEQDMTAAQWIVSEAGARVKSYATQLQSMTSGAMIHQLRTKNGAVFGNKLVCLNYINDITDSQFIKKVGNYLTMENLITTDSYSVLGGDDAKIVKMPSDIKDFSDLVVDAEKNDKATEQHSRLNLFEARNHTTRYLNQVVYRNVIALLNAERGSDIGHTDASLLIISKFLSRVHNFTYNAILRNDHEALMGALLKECGNPYATRGESPRIYFTAPVEELFVIAEMEIARAISNAEPFSDLNSFEALCVHISRKIHGKRLFKTLVDSSGPFVTIMQKTHKSVVTQVLLNTSGNLISRVIVK